MFGSIVGNGIRYAGRFRLVLPLYLAVLLLSLFQIWPLFGADRLMNPLLTQLADRPADLLVDIMSNAPDQAGRTVAAWSGLTVLLTLLFGAIYNFFSGGILSVWHGSRSLWEGSRYFFLCFSGLGLVLGFLLMIALAIGIGIGMRAGAMAGAISAIVLLQLVNLFGEYARAAAVIQNRRNPLLLLGRAMRVVMTKLPGVLMLAIVGLGLHSAVALLYGSLTTRVSGFPITILVEQSVILAWLWIKLLRLAWALSLTAAT